MSTFVVSSAQANGCISSNSARQGIANRHFMFWYSVIRSLEIAKPNIAQGELHLQNSTAGASRDVPHRFFAYALFVARAEILGSPSTDNLSSAIECDKASCPAVRPRLPCPAGRGPAGGPYLGIVATCR